MPQSGTMIRSFDDLPELSTTEEVAAVLRCTPRTVNNLCAKGDIPAAKIAGAWLIDRADLRAYVDGEKRRCQNETAGHTFTGVKTENYGKSGGTSMASDERAQRALRTADKLTKHSKTSSQGAQVIRIGGTS